MKNKPYIILYLIFLGISITNIIQTGLALSTGRFIELNPIGYNLILFFLTILVYLFLLIPFFIKDKLYRKVFLIGIFYLIILGIITFIHDFIAFNEV